MSGRPGLGLSAPAGALPSRGASRARHTLLHAVMKNGKAKAWPESSRLLVKMIEMEEVYHIATSPTVGGSVPHRSQSYRMRLCRRRQAVAPAVDLRTCALRWRGASTSAASILISYHLYKRSVSK